MKIIFSGGGTLGPVAPLLAVREVIIQKYPKAQFVWVGTKSGPERAIIEQAGVPFFVIGAGKWRRYFSFWNIVDFFKIFIAFWQALFFLVKEKPDLLVSAGGFVSVPLHWAGALLGMAAWIHQQDVEVGLANKLMCPFAEKITTALRETARRLSSYQAEWIGNPSRNLFFKNQMGVQDFETLQQARQKFTIPHGAPIIFALGGGTGSASINRVVLEALPHWPNSWHVIHLVGKERPHELPTKAAGAFNNYHVYQFFTEEMKAAYAIADVVVARAGFSTLTELAALSKAAVILPMFGTHQEDNARYLAEKQGIVMLDNVSDSGLKLARIIKELIDAPERRAVLGERLHAVLPRAEPGKIIEIVEKLVG